MSRRSNNVSRGRMFGGSIHRSPRPAPLLLCGLLCLASCTGEVSDVGTPGAAGTGSSSAVGGSSPAAAGGAASSAQGGAGPAAVGGGPAAVGGQANPGQGGSTAPGDDPYAIPASPPASVLVATPRLARLSRKQWSNTVRDLLKLADISEIDQGVSGDALVGFDNEADRCSWARCCVRSWRPLRKSSPSA